MLEVKHGYYCRGAFDRVSALSAAEIATRYSEVPMPQRLRLICWSCKKGLNNILWNFDIILFLKVRNVYVVVRKE